MISKDRKEITFDNGKVTKRPSDFMIVVISSQEPDKILDTFNTVRIRMVGGGTSIIDIHTKIRAGGL